MVKPLTPIEKRLNVSLINPHPDGKPWNKCCKAPSDNELMCQCLMRKPQNAPSRCDKFFDGSLGAIGETKRHLLDAIGEGGRFFCCHRSTEDGYHRECAGWAAKYSKNR